MLLQIADVLSAETVLAMRQSLEREAASFVSGKASAGWYAKDVKNNDQSAGSAAQAAMEQAKAALLANPVFQSAVRPKAFVKTLVSRYRPGMAYGRHVDDALMGGMRTDMSFTLFLSDPATYEGGEIVIESADGESDFKLPAGHMVLYQTTSLHHVAEVTRGERLAIVGWVRSFIRSAEQRETLFELDQAVAGLRQNGAERKLMDHVLKVRNTLIRMWAED
ncbi:MAG: Fe2+-dependent dioxygenase [Rhizobiales bacterium]|nr:Fe2+-dependent dioxygenase [Hyphomicrobiales bacterium]